MVRVRIGRLVMLGVFLHQHIETDVFVIHFTSSENDLTQLLVAVLAAGASL